MCAVTKVSTFVNGVGLPPIVDVSLVALSALSQVNPVTVLHHSFNRNTLKADSNNIALLVC